MAKIRELKHTHVDADGVITQTADIYILKTLPPEPAYVKMYIEDIGRMSGLQSAHAEILFYVAAMVDYDGIVMLSGRRKKIIADSFGGSVKTVDNAITAYIKSGLLFRVARGEYELNPSLFARGEWKTIMERRTAFMVNIKYSLENGRKVLELVPDAEPEKSIN